MSSQGQLFWPLYIGICMLTHVQAHRPVVFHSQLLKVHEREDEDDGAEEATLSVLSLHRSTDWYIYIDQRLHSLVSCCFIYHAQGKLVSNRSGGDVYRQVCAVYERERCALVVLSICNCFMTALSCGREEERGRGWRYTCHALCCTSSWAPPQRHSRKGQECPIPCLTIISNLGEIEYVHPNPYTCRAHVLIEGTIFTSPYLNISTTRNPQCGSRLSLRYQSYQALKTQKTSTKVNHIIEVLTEILHSTPQRKHSTPLSLHLPTHAQIS